jgi:hypothetical protein
VSDSSERYLKLLKQNLDKVTIGVLGIMTMGLGVAIFMEKSSDMVASIPEPEILRLEDPLEKNPNWRLVQAMMSPQEISKYPAIRQIRQYNMFDYKSVRDREAVDRAANQKFEQAKKAESEGKTEEAKRLAEEVLASIPAHRAARELLDKLNKPAEGAKSASKPAPPAAGAAPVAAPAGGR